MRNLLVVLRNLLVLPAQFTRNSSFWRPCKFLTFNSLQARREGGKNK